MSADDLRRAAALIRARVRAATPGPWWASGAWFHDGFPWPLVGHGRTGADVIAHTARPDGGDAAHIASWHPAVALAVADWLDKEAEGFDLIEATTRVAIEIGVDSRIKHSTHDEALAVARAYLGESP